MKVAPRPIEPPVGAVFGRLIVIGAGVMTEAKRPRTTWLCECTCGNTKSIKPGDLRSGTIVSCGCYQSEQAAASIKSNVHDSFAGFGTGPNFKHGQSRAGLGTATYRTWLAMRDRCKDPNRHNAANYIEKGITVCDSWQGSFENFFADMGPRPIGMTLDRLDGDKGYSPDNCRWATPKQQAQNRN